MKNPKDPRHLHRITVMQELFAWNFQQSEPFQTVESQEIISKVEDIDAQISKAAPTWPIEKINRIDLSILRQAIFEINEAKVPSKVAIDEAIELAKSFGSASSPAFVNGVLAKIVGNSN